MKPILFNTEMVRALLKGRKTVTRRVVKPQPKEAHTVMDRDDEAHTFDLLCGNGGKGGIFADWAETVKAPFWPGDILYVRETFCVDYLSNIPGSGRVHYKADDTYADITFAPQRYDMMRRAQLKPGWRPNENMPREVARLFLRVPDVRVERLQDMSMSAMQAEGMIPANVSGGNWQQWQYDYARPVWNSTIKPADRDRYGWAANPWVWVIEFERISKEAALQTQKGNDEE